MSLTKEEKKSFLTKSYNLARSAYEWKSVAFFEGVIILFLIGFMIYQLNNVPVRLVPQFNMDKEYVTKENSSDYEYLKVVSSYDLNNFASYTPETIEFQSKNLLKRLSPSAYADYSRLLTKRIEVIKSQKISQSFSPVDIRVFNGKSILFKGIEKRWVGRDSVFEGEKVFVIKYEIINGIPKIASIKEFKKYDDAVDFARL